MIDQVMDTMKDDSDDGEKRGKTIKAISIVMRFIRVMTESTTPLPLGELAKRAQVAPSSAHRYMQSLIAEGLVVQDAASGNYDLGPEALNVGAAALKRVDAVSSGAHQMKMLSMNSALSSGVVIWTVRGPTVVRWYRSAYYTINTVSLGDLLPLDNSASGLVFQAFLHESKIETARANQPEHFRGAPPSEDLLAEIRGKCFSELNEHIFSSVTGRAAPVFDSQDELACVVTTVSSVNVEGAEVGRNAFLAAARAATREAGGTRSLTTA